MNYAILHHNYILFKTGKIYSTKSKKFISTHKQPKQEYYKAHLYHKNKQNSIWIHRELAKAFIPNPHNYPVVDHINRDKSDHRLENLRWVPLKTNHHNREANKNNKLGIKNIGIHQSKPHHNITYVFKMIIDNKKHSKNFKTLCEAIEYKKKFYEINKLEYI